MSAIWRAALKTVALMAMCLEFPLGFNWVFFSRAFYATCPDCAGWYCAAVPTIIRPHTDLLLDIYQNAAIHLWYQPSNRAAGRARTGRVQCGRDGERPARPGRERLGKRSGYPVPPQPPAGVLQR